MLGLNVRVNVKVMDRVGVSVKVRWRRNGVTVVGRGVEVSE